MSDKLKGLLTKLDEYLTKEYIIGVCSLYCMHSCLCTCVYMYVCRCVFVCVCVCVCACACMCMCMCMHVRVRLLICMYVCTSCVSYMNFVCIRVRCVIIYTHTTVVHGCVICRHDGATIK